MVIDRARLTKIARALDAVRERCEVSSRLSADPVHFVHAYADPDDREIVAMIASALAFGNVKAFSAKIAQVLELMAPSPAKAADDPKALRAALRGFKHRFCTGGDLAALVIGARIVQRAEGSLGEALRRAVQQEGEGSPKADLLAGLILWTRAIRSAGGLDRRTTHGARHILPKPEAGSANKRLLLMLRWMVRPADGVDLGVWPLSPSSLLMPVDVHVHKLARNIGLTERNAASWKAAVDITSQLARIDPTDPTKYDFALCHLGMVQRCPSRRDPVRCEGCGVKPICRHWSRGAARAES